MEKEINWQDYYKVRNNNPPREPLLIALKNFSSEGYNSGKAFDLGCGAGNDTLELLKRNWNVIAMDNNKEVLTYLESFKKKFPDKLEVQIASFENINWQRVNLINASYSLPFCPKKYFPDLWDNIKSSIKMSGRFCGQFFGERDEWDLTKQTEAELLEMFDGFNFEHFNEVEKDGETALGEFKHWHFFEVVAKKNR